MGKFPLPRLPVALALFILAGQLVIVAYFGQAVLNPNVLLAFGGVALLATALVALGYRPPCSLYYEWRTAPYKRTTYTLAAHHCGRESSGSVEVNKVLEYVDDDGELRKITNCPKEFFCSEHDPALAWMQDWLMRERINIAGPARYFRFL